MLQGDAVSGWRRHFLTVEQLIPLPEAEELMIGICEKEVAEQSIEKGQAARYQLRTDFWHQTLEALQDAKVSLYSNVGLAGAHYAMIFNRDEVRVNFVLDRAQKGQNKTLFDILHAQSSALDQAFGAPLAWRRMGDKKVSIIE